MASLPPQCTARSFGVSAGWVVSSQSSPVPAPSSKRDRIGRPPCTILWALMVSLGLGISDEDPAHYLGCRMCGSVRDMGTSVTLRWSTVLPLVVLGACQQPTEVLVELTTDVDCRDLRNTSITTGSLSDLEQRPASIATTRCDPTRGRIGSIVVFPRNGDDDSFALRVVAGLLKDWKRSSKSAKLRSWRSDPPLPIGPFADPCTRSTSYLLSAAVTPCCRRCMMAAT